MTKKIQVKLKERRWQDGYCLAMLSLYYARKDTAISIFFNLSGLLVFIESYER